MIRQQYRFTYDFSNRLLSANHFTHNGTAWVNTNNYSESSIAYDLNGNIKTYTRRGQMPDLSFNVIDNLTYTYGDAARPDRLTNVSDAGNAVKGFKFTAGAAAYAYDLNGNLTQDNHKSLTLAYNYLNLPNFIVDPGGAEITLTYTADGEKLTKLSPAGTQNYVSGLEYLGNALDAIYHSEGRCTPNGATAFHYEYTIKDHLGNARINFRANGAAVTFLQELHYYPFGMLMEGIGTVKVTNNGYKYNGKELNEDLGLNLSDYGARWYDASLGRWWSVDLMAGKYASYSPYNYAANNPILIIDPNGMELYIKNNANYGQAVMDIINLVNNSKFQGKVSINFTTKDGGGKDGDIKAEVSFIGITQETVDNDAGLSLLDNVSKSDNKYLYEVASSVTGTDRESGEELPVYKLGSEKVRGTIGLNLSTTPRGDAPRDGSEAAKLAFKQFDAIPAGGYDAHTVISPNAGDATYQDEKGKDHKVDRTWFTFHELQECYYRTDKGNNYQSAHKRAMEDGTRFYRTPKGFDQKPTNPYSVPLHLRKKH